MKKNFSIFTTLCLLLIVSITFTACSIGSVTLTYYDKQGNTLKTETYSINQSLSSLPTAPQIYGFSFKGWGTSATDESVVSTPYTVSHNALYAKYTILNSWFTTSGHNQTFYGNSLYWRVEEHSANTYEILIDDIIGSSNISYISVIGEAGGTFELKTMKLLDEYANEVQDNDSAENVWTPKISFSSNNIGKYVLSIEVTTNGAFYIDLR